MTITSTQKTPVADELGGDRDEGLMNPTTMKEQEIMTSLSAAVQTRISLDQHTVIDVDPRDENVEVTISSRNEFGETRSTFGIALAPDEARNLASALLDGVAPAFGSADLEEIEEHAAIARRLPVEIPVSDLAAGTVTDIFRWSIDNGVPIAQTTEAVETYLKGLQAVEGVSPAEWCRRRRAEAQAVRA